VGSILKTMERKEYTHTTLVTGCSGLVGYHVVKKLAESIPDGYLVVGIDIKEPKYDYKQYGDKFVFHNIDLTDYYKVSSIFELYNINDVMNCFGIKGTPKTAKSYPVNFLVPSIQANINLIKNCQHHSAYMCFLSSVGVYASAEEFEEDTVWETLPSQHDWFPAWSKRVPELIIDAYRQQFGWINWTILRPSNIFGEYDNYGENAMAIPATIKKVFESNGEIEAWGDGTPIRDYVYAGDVAEACLISAKKRLHTEIINVGSGVETTIKEMIETTIKVSGKDIKINWDTSKPNGEPKRKMNTEKQEDYGLLPKYGFEEGIRKTYEHYKNNINE
tara:strand:- start:88 stop:1083 length:996 start_codon:yes stop_codon:yes gene_type:complete